MPGSLPKWATMALHPASTAPRAGEHAELLDLRVALENELARLHGAHVGDYRVIYRIDDEQRTVEVLRIVRRADVYRRR